MFCKVSIKIMGIINCTPDSFSGDGINKSVDSAIKQAQYFIDNGARILDIGGESTRPAADLIETEKEILRIQPIVNAIRNKFPDIDISIDTYKSAVAEVALDNGANIINDVWGGTIDKFILKIAKKYDVPICLMHNKSKPKNIEIDAKLGGIYKAPVYNNFLNKLLQELKQLAQNAIDVGIKQENIILDPGIGFGKTSTQNMQIINNLDKIKDLGFPILVGASRKSFIGQELDCEVNDRLNGTIATTVIATQKQVDIIRVHDVKENFQAMLMTKKIMNSGK